MLERLRPSRRANDEAEAHRHGKKRKPVHEYLKRQGRFAHFTDEDVEHFQSEVDKMWTEWLIPGVIPFTVPAKDQAILKVDKRAKPLHEETAKTA